MYQENRQKLKGNSSLFINNLLNKYIIKKIRLRNKFVKRRKEKIVKLQKPKKLLHKLVTKSETKLLRKPEKKYIADKRTYWSNGKIVLVENERKIIR